jgi:hypothetical protein
VRSRSSALSSSARGTPLATGRVGSGRPKGDRQAIFAVVDAKEPSLRLFLGEAPLGLAKADYPSVSKRGGLERRISRSVRRLTDLQVRPRPEGCASAIVRFRVNADGRRAPRTAICIKERGLEMEVVVAGLEGRPEPTLRELAEELAQDGCEEALNLDGGPSSGWASRADGGITFDSPRAPVRHAVVVRHR